MILLRLPRHCVRCKESTIHVHEHLPEYIEVRCTICEQPTKRISYEVAWKRLQKALADVEPEG